jgi:hypothetical protein
MKVERTLTAVRTDAKSAWGVCVPLSSAKSIASVVIDAGDGLQPSLQLDGPGSSPGGSVVVGVLWGRSMSYRAIAAALALEDVSVGERLVAFSLASYAGRDHLAWPAVRTAAARAGLGRRQFLNARDRLLDRGLIALEDDERGASAVRRVRVRFAEDGWSVEREINAELFEAVLSHSPARGGARALLAVLAALGGRDGVVAGVSAEELREAAGLSDRTYRRARAQLLASGAVTLHSAGGGRGNRNEWRVEDPRQADMPRRQSEPTRAVAIPRQMPLMAAVRDPAAVTDAQGTPVSERVSAAGQLSGLVGGNPGVNPGQKCTPRASETPAQTPAETPALYVRAGRESQNLKTAPPDPPEGGQDSLTISEPFISPTGRRRVRTARVDQIAVRAELQAPTAEDQRDWQRARAALAERIGADQFEVWLAGFSLVAIAGRERVLLLDGPPLMRTWVSQRFAAALSDAAVSTGRVVRVVSARELALLSALADADTAASPANTGSESAVPIDDKEAV